jgi:hypothetical protein
MECIPLSEFLYKNAQAIPAFEAKAAHMKTAHKCFQASISAAANSGSNTHTKWVRLTEKRPQPKFINSTSEEDLARKEFLPLMNKLTLKNKNSIFIQVRRCIKQAFIGVYIDIVWDLCLNCPTYQELYIEVLDLIRTLGSEKCKELLQLRFDTFMDNKMYLMPEEVLSDQESYDEFCASVKWKKRALSTIQLHILLEKKCLLDSTVILCQKILEMSETYMKAGSYTQIDPLLEQLYILYTDNNATQKPYFDDITSFVQKWLQHADTMKLSTKFKFYNFSEALEKKSAKTRWR